METTPATTNEELIFELKPTINYKVLSLEDYFRACELIIMAELTKPFRIPHHVFDGTSSTNSTSDTPIIVGPSSE